MKNLTIKKVALGLFLAGYAASSAFAALEASSVNVIKGNAPFIKANSGANEHTMTLKVTTDADGNTPISSDNNRQRVKVGDYIHITYDLVDNDGDTDTTGAMKATLKVYKIAQDGKPTEVTVSVQDDSTASQGHLSFKITNDFAGAKTIGYTIQEKTSFGLPDHGQYLAVSDIFSSTDPEHSDSEQTPTGDHGPGNTPEPIVGPIDSDSMRVGIFRKVGNTMVNYAKPGSPTIPKYGDEFKAIVWNDANNDFAIDSGEDKFTNYTFTWTLVNLDYVDEQNPGTGTGYEGVDALSTSLPSNGDTITLGNSNSMYDPAYKAGGQGYRLKVKATVKP
ncbi:hypothetical protein [Gilliamella intestini]|uniref:Uncharacterized protein n=1 Tax=Gilliamella intestini TaxID=1798183 RepID=A0A1C4C355_9GAMM|nr:hypothetical protein [Gilliamella intestini]SCC13433.1 hypothetical protein GA0061080_10291 [Gilliamella intestini]